jgi:hypothetical protein
MTYTTEDLYELLPAVYRVRDAERGLALRALVGVLARQADAMDRDIESLYADWFIETCAPWVVPYIGDLLRMRGLIVTGGSPADGLSVLGTSFSQRAYVANTIRYRRRKGTPAVLEQLAYDVTGWRGRVVEFFHLLGTTQYLNHPRPLNVRTPDLRRTDVLDLEGTAFDAIAHTAEVRPVDPPITGDDRRRPVGRGRYDIANVGLYLWRLSTLPVTRSAPRLVSAPAGFSFSPLGMDGPLFNPPRTEPEITHLAEEIDLPVPLRRRALYDELETRRQAIVDGTEPVPGFLGSDDPAVRVFLQTPSDASPIEVPPEEILVCDLETWDRPDATRAYTPTDGGAAEPLPITVAVDPVLGRLSFADGVQPDRVQVSFGYGSGGDVGGGPYDRRDGVALWMDPGAVAWQAGVVTDLPADPTSLFTTLRDAVDAWNTFVGTHPGAFGLISVMDSETYVGDLTGPTYAIDIPSGARLGIVAAGWPEVVDPILGGTPARTTGVISPDDPLRPHVLGNVSVHGSAGTTAAPGELVIQGLLIEGALTVLTGNLGRLRLIDATLVPANGGLIVNPSVTKGQQNARLRVDVDRSIIGPISLPETVPSLHVADTIIDGIGGPAIDASGAGTEIQRSTVLGTTDARTVTASNGIFLGALAAGLVQEGCVRFSSVAPGSTTPRRFRCQPDLALTGVTDAAVAARVGAEMIPAFTSTRYGDPGYAQLALTCATAIRTGAEDGSEMGVFSSLHQPQREANLRASLDEYLRFGLEAGVFFVT